MAEYAMRDGTALGKLGGDVRAILRLAAGYRRFAHEPVSLTSALARIQARQARREEAFIRFAAERIYGFPKSPYLPLLRAAGCELGDLEKTVENHGLEEALRRLAEGGVRVSIDEFKGNIPMVRGELKLKLVERDFDNPYLAHHLEVQSGGTRSAGTRVLVDLDFLHALAEPTAVAFEAHSLWDATLAIWLPVGGTALAALNIYAKLGKTPARWFTQVRPRSLRARQRWWTWFVVRWGRLAGGKLPLPEHVALGDSEKVARWMAGEIQQKRRPCLMTYASSAVRVCQAAVQERLDLDGSSFITIGEPLTAAKRKAIENTGARVLVRYAATEVGILGYGCASPLADDDMHFLSDQLALIRRPRPVGPEAVLVNGLLVTSLLLESPKALLNVEMGDYAEVFERSCGCPLESAGLTTHLKEVRSFEKLTGEGMTFVGTRLIRVVEEILPSRFGGRPTDYQLVEREGEDGITRLELRVDPSIGAVDERQLVETFFACLEAGPEMGFMAEIWKQAGILAVRRLPPLPTGMGKILPFHLVQRIPGEKVAS